MLKKMEAALGLLRRMPPKQSETALSALLSLLPQHSSDLLSQVDLPLQVTLSLSRFKMSFFILLPESCLFIGSSGLNGIALFLVNRYET